MDTSDRDIHDNFVKQQVVNNIDVELFKSYRAYIFKLKKELIEAQKSIAGEVGFKYKGELYATPKGLPTTIILHESLHHQMDTILELESQLNNEHNFIHNYLVKRLHSCRTYEGIYYALPESLREYFISMYSLSLNGGFSEPKHDIFENDINDIVAKCKMMNILLNG